MVTKERPITAAKPAAWAFGLVIDMDRIVGFPGFDRRHGFVGKSELARSEPECDILFIDRSVNELHLSRDHAFVGRAVVSDASAEPAAAPR